jgi:hypothetical protein
MISSFPAKVKLYFRDVSEPGRLHAKFDTPRWWAAQVVGKPAEVNGSPVADWRRRE